MINIFNLFLFLLAIWSLFLAISGKISLFYIIFGIFSCIFVSFSSFKLKLIEEKSELLYLSFGFYRHFVKLFLHNFLSSMILIVKMALKNQVKPFVTKISIKGEKDPLILALLTIHCNMKTGVLAISTEKNYILLHIIEECYFKNFDLRKTLRSLDKVNDDNIV